MEMPYKDKTQQKEYKIKWNKEYYCKNKQQELERIQKRKQKIKMWFNSYKATLCCSNCDEKNSVCLEFHHKNIEQKSFAINEALGKKGCSKESILNEIKKCTILCANCHRKIHAKRDIWGLRFES